MSKYTTEVRFICEQQAGLEDSKGYNDVGNIIASARTHIFDFTYPIFDNNYKPALETKILMHYYTREISEETYGLWKLRLRTRLNEIMPYYNKLYESELIEFNPLWDTDMTIDRDITLENAHEDETTHDNTLAKTGTVGDSFTSNRSVTTGGSDISALSGTDASTTGGTDRVSASGTDTTGYTKSDKDNTWDLYSDTPQGSIKGIQGAEDDPSLGDNGYLTNARHIIGDTTGSAGSGTATYGRTDTTTYGKTGSTTYGRTDTTSYGKTGSESLATSDTVTHNTREDFDGNTTTDGTYTDTTDYLERITGYRGRSPVEAIMKLRESFLNIDMMIIKELRDLFFNLW